ncbi:hypothetical protein [Yeosuana sp. AK3]
MILKIFKDYFFELFNSKKFNIKLLALLLSADLMFIVFHCLYVYSLNNSNHIFMFNMNSLYSIESDQGYSEIFQYIKEFWIFIIFLVLSIKKKKSVYLIWSLLFLYLLLDDSFSIHEIFGEYLSKYLNIKPEINLRAVDFGELIVSFGIVFIFIISLIIAHYKVSIKAKKESIHIFILLLFLVFFGIFVDMLHVFFHDDWKLGLTEDGGEMIAMSLITAFVFNLYNIKE